MPGTVAAGRLWAVRKRYRPRTTSDRLVRAEQLNPIVQASWCRREGQDFYTSAHACDCLPQCRVGMCHSEHCVRRRCHRYRVAMPAQDMPQNSTTGTTHLSRSSNPRQPAIAHAALSHTLLRSHSQQSQHKNQCTARRRKWGRQCARCQESNETRQQHNKQGRRISTCRQR